MAGTAAAHDHDHVVSGILCRIGSGFSFATMGALLKLASEQGLNAPELVFYRSLFSLPVVLFWVLKRESLARSAQTGRSRTSGGAGSACCPWA